MEAFSVIGSKLGKVRFPYYVFCNREVDDADQTFFLVEDKMGFPINLMHIRGASPDIYQ